MYTIVEIVSSLSNNPMIPLFSPIASSLQKIYGIGLLLQAPFSYFC